MNTLKDIEKLVQTINTWEETADSKFRIEFKQGNSG